MSGETNTSFRYEQRVSEDHWLAVREGGAQFAGGGTVFETLRRLASKLEDIGVPYTVAGGMALNFHGFVRFTDDLDLVVTRDGLTTIQSKLSGLGYLPVFAGSKNLRDTKTGVRIEFLISGEFPGDGKPKPVAFPDPVDTSIEIDGISILQLPRLIELKLASGMSLEHRMRDLADVIDLVSALKLTTDIADQLDPSVREKYLELWKAAQSAREP